MSVCEVARAFLLDAIEMELLSSLVRWSTEYFIVKNLDIDLCLLSFYYQK